MVSACAFWCNSTGSKSKKHDKMLMQNCHVILLNLMSFFYRLGRFSWKVSVWLLMGSLKLFLRTVPFIDVPGAYQKPIACDGTSTREIDTQGEQNHGNTSSRKYLLSLVLYLHRKEPQMTLCFLGGNDQWWVASLPEGICDSRELQNK